VPKVLVAGEALIDLAISPDGSIAAYPAPGVEVVETIGAGDVFMGAFLAYWHSRGFGQRELGASEHVEAAVESACGVAARACSRAGVDPPRAALS
jgi:fructokinase